MKREKVFIEKHRPEGYLGQGNAYLPSMSERVIRILAVENERMNDLLWLSDGEIEGLACLITEFG